jgi:hypothetical protein
MQNINKHIKTLKRRAAFLRQRIAEEIRFESRLFDRQEVAALEHALSLMISARLAARSSWELARAQRSQSLDSGIMAVG